MKRKAIYLRLQSKATTFSFYGQKGLVCIIARGVKALNAIKRKPNIGADIVNIILYYFVLLFHVRKYFTTRAQDQYKIKELDLFYLFWQLTFSAHCSCHSVVYTRAQNVWHGWPVYEVKCLCFNIRIQASAQSR